MTPTTNNIKQEYRFCSIDCTCTSSISYQHLCLRSEHETRVQMTLKNRVRNSVSDGGDGENKSSSSASSRQGTSKAGGPGGLTRSTIPTGSQQKQQQLCMKILCFSIVLIPMIWWVHRFQNVISNMSSSIMNVDSSVLYNDNNNNNNQTTTIIENNSKSNVWCNDYSVCGIIY